ncbi:PREDICTED: phosphoinositide phosphatase SAC3-like isoform X2 [Tarenaya hassleriana]|uniref:phosphoinositide phosphatase SAC3-like isoform X2 n=1 Tax=Tarenaya hassleriana TaxID=28532 RepID=UPI00053C842F|nr:PREDICTED: phosphoinositide phosphatase SAC3-like isoform X2 [Tarenaya hassleriana]
MASTPSPENESLGSYGSPAPRYSMQEFKLFETQSNFYMIGWDGSGVYRVLKIDRLDPSELSISEDSTAYTKRECYELLKRIHEGNKVTGGLKLVTVCYGIIGFIKFLGPYYMLLITERRKIGAICGHSVYAVSKSEIITLQNSSVPCNFVNSRDENRYKKLLCMVELTKDFFFSYSYNIMRSLQKNICDYETGHVLYEKMFVWNEFLTRGIRNHLKNTLWTVALVYGFFKQVTLSESERNFKLTLIARRSRHNAGTRYLKRGVNENGNVANDVETEQIVSEDVAEGSPMHISSVVQNRGSIPLFWSQETSRLNLKPDIVLSKKDPNYDATRLHFQNLVERYGNSIIILNLIKTKEKRPRESILRAEFANAIDFINKDLSEETRLRFLHWDLHKHFQSKTTNVLALLGKVAAYALMLTGFFYCQVTPTMKLEGYMSLSSSDADTENLSPQNSSDDDNGGCDIPEKNTSRSKNIANGNCDIKPPRFQKGVLRTNCIDCLDRTNVAQYAYGWAALGQQLLILGIRDAPAIELDDPLAIVLMGFYERMGDTLAHQYGGSAAHNKVFSERRGQWRAATQSQEFFRTLQRYYNNAYMDADKQDAINLFLGNFQPEQGRPAIWELRSDSRPNGRNGEMSADEDERFHVKRCLSDGNILNESRTPMSAMSSKHESISHKVFSEPSRGVSHILSESSPDISTSEDVALSRCTPSMPRRQLFGDVQKVQHLGSDPGYLSEQEDLCSVSNFVDIERLSSSESLLENDLFDRLPTLTGYSTAEMSSSENIINGGIGQSTPPSCECGPSSRKGKEPIGTDLSVHAKIREDFSDSFKQWVAYGEALCH